MSSELLRRAAAKLREHAEAATPGWYSDAGRIRAPKIDHLLKLDGKDPAVAIFRRTADEAYAGLMHPPVALALATALEDWAEAVDGVDKMLGRIPDDAYQAEFALARAILREAP